MAILNPKLHGLNLGSMAILNPKLYRLNLGSMVIQCDLVGFGGCLVGLWTPGNVELNSVCWN